MSQPQMQQNQSGQSNQPKTFKIRMKPGKGRMLIGRAWRLPNGEVTKVRPKSIDDREVPIDEYLEARTKDDDGNWSDGPVATVTEDVIAAFLLDSGGKPHKDGQPHRFIEGYKMREEKATLATDIAGFQREIAENWYPSKDRGVFDDCPFELVR